MKRAFFSVLLLAAMLFAVALSFAEPLALPRDSADSSTSAGDAAPPSLAASPKAGPTSASPHGTAPLPDDSKVPHKWLPPGSFEPDTGPSAIVYPPQKLTIRFNHKLHVSVGAKCATCHPGATTSESVGDRLTPPGATCDTCHLTNHADLANVKASGSATGACNFCHEGYKDGDGNRVAKLVLPRANMVFNHKKHAVRNIACGQCHGHVEELELATRDQLPRMRGCFGCHQQTDSAARGQAKSDCTTCHVSGGADGTTQALPGRLSESGGALNATGGKMRTDFASGTMKPPRWMHNAGHDADFIERHKMVAATDSQFCSNCHKEDFCTGCHDGRVRPRSIHPNDYLAMHPIEARQATQKCTSCHREQSFCLGCHQRLGITMNGPPGVRESGRFHPPKFIWSDAPRKPGHHSQEAMRNLNACVSCHTERDCVGCHGGAGIGGGFNPHNASFSSNCASQFRRNPRPCLVCHEPAAPALARCR